MISNKTESGRSTVEMLTVIVIGTILTLGCVWAIGYALNYVKANAIVSGAQTRIAAVDRRNIQRDVTKMAQVLKGFAKTDGQDYIYDIYPTSLHILTESEQSALKIPGPVLEVTRISKGVCRLLKHRTEAPMWINKQMQRVADCHEKDNIAWFELTLLNHIHDPDPVDLCAGNSCICGCNAGVCIEPITYGVCEGTSCVQRGCCPDDCPVDECETNAQCGGGQCTVVEQNYNDKDDIGVCKQCSNGSVIDKPGYVVPDCQECGLDGSLSPITSSTTDSSGRCCVNGVRTYDATLCPDPSTQCTIGTTTYNDGAPISECGKCNNGSIDVDTSKVTDCHTCDTTNYTLTAITSSDKDSSGKCCVAGERKYDATSCPDPSTQCTIGTTTYNDGDPIGTCKKCSGGDIIDNPDYEVPDCNVCNADGTVSLKDESKTLPCGDKCCGDEGCKKDKSDCCPEHSSNTETEYQLGETGCYCEEGYVPNDDNTECEQTFCKEKMLAAGYKYDPNGVNQTFSVSGNTITYVATSGNNMSISRGEDLDIHECNLIVKGGSLAVSRATLLVHDLTVQNSRSEGVRLEWGATIVANDINFSGVGGYTTGGIYNFGSTLTANSISGTVTKGSGIDNSGVITVAGDINVTGEKGVKIYSNGSLSCASLSGTGTKESGIWVAGQLIVTGSMTARSDPYYGLYIQDGTTTAGSVSVTGRNGFYMPGGNLTVNGGITATASDSYNGSMGGTISATGNIKFIGKDRFLIYNSVNSVTAPMVEGCTKTGCVSICNYQGVTCTSN